MSAALVITPEALKEFLEIYRRTDLRPLAKPERTLLRIFRKAKEMPRRAGLKNIVFYFVSDYLFIVSVETERTLLKVTNIERRFDAEKIAEEMLSMGIPEGVKRTPLDMSRVCFTNHALERFAERFSPNASNQEEAARLLLADAVEGGAINEIARVKRIIENRFDKTRYFINDTCRFVIIEDTGAFVVVTIERDYSKEYEPAV